MVSYIRSDLDFILAQIKTSEAHAAGQPLYGPGGLIPSYNTSAGVRTVDGTYNNLLPGQETWGAAHVPFVETLDPVFRDAESVVVDFDGPGPALPITTQTSYAPSDDPNSLVFDPALRTISNLVVDQTLNNPAAIMKGLESGGVAPADLATVALVRAVQATYLAAVDAAAGDPVLLAAALEARNTDLLTNYGIAMDGDNVQISNVSPDEGLSAPFNSWFTLFGQFFDHGLDLVNKGGSGTVYIPLQPDDPLYVEGANTNFMVLTRATVGPGADGIMGTADDQKPVNVTTPFVDQNQTYTSHSSHQVFLRQYELNGANQPVETGKLIEGGGAQPGGMATWGEVKAQAASMLGIQLTDFDVGNVPLLRTDQYGNFIRDANGMPQIITGIGADGIPNTADDIVVSGNLAAPVDPTVVGALRANVGFLVDIAHEAVPFGKISDGDIEIGLGNPGNGATEYDNELLDAHFIAGDGRANENIGLTAVHTIFHSEHNRLVDHTKEVLVADANKMLADGASQADAVAFLNEWLTEAVTTVPAGVAGLVWNGERLFQAAKFGTEMQYQHLVFEDFARKVQPGIDFFVVPDGYHADIDPSIVAEFAHVVYRFGHSMLTESIDRFDTNFDADHIGLIDAFLNPIAFDANHTIEDGVAAGAVIRGMTRQVGNEIDEFVTSALRNNLLGLPLDLATINLARGRDAGVPSLNAARRDFYEASQNAPELKPYTSWVDFAGNLKNEASIINFIAAYGTHPDIIAETTIEGKRDVAIAIVTGAPVNGHLVPTDSVAFLNATGPVWGSGNFALGGLDNVDFWIGGLAEAIMPFGGMLGSTFNFVFEAQLQALQDGDRFYYLQRLDGLHLLAEMENNTFSKLMIKNSDLDHLPADVFSTPGLILEVDQTKQYNPGLGETAGADGILLDDPLTAVNEAADNLGNDPTGDSLLTPLVIRDDAATPGPDANYLRYTGDEHVLLGGTDGDDTIMGSIGDDTLFGDAGNDRMEGGSGNDQFFGGDGDDIITDTFGDDVVRSGAGHDAINVGQGVDLVVSEDGQDFIVLGEDGLDEAFAGLGNDFVLGSKTTEQTLGGEGDDWIEWGAWTGAVGDNFEPNSTDSIAGHDVFHGLGGFDEFIGEGGDDIYFGSIGRGKFDGDSGFDWATYAELEIPADVNLERVIANPAPIPETELALDTFQFVEAVSGSVHDDLIVGDDIADLAATTGVGAAVGAGTRGSVLDAAGIARIAGLQGVVGAGVNSFSTGNILLGGDGNDTIEGKGGDDIIDGDKWLNVGIAVHETAGADGGEGAILKTVQSMTELVSEIFAGTINPGQLNIFREILQADGTGDVDTAVFSDVRASYDVTFNPDGTITVAHVGGTLTDGTDTLSNIERIRFADETLIVENIAPTGLPVISDLTPTQDEAISVTTDQIMDANGLTNAVFAIQWQQGSSASGIWTDIPGATGANFTPTAGQINQQLRAVVSFTDDFGTAEQLIATETAPTGLHYVGTNGANAAVGTPLGADTMDGLGRADALSGLGGDDLLNGGNGNDTLDGGAGNDTLNGEGGGNDLLIGGEGDDTLDGGAGNNDRAQFAGPVSDYDFALDASGSIVVTDNAGTDGTDTLVNVERMVFDGTTYRVAGGTNAAETINGGNGRQAVLGFDGNDTLSGNAGPDYIHGGDGDDTIVWNANEAGTPIDGRDTINGGAGIDTFQLNGRSTGTETFRIYTAAAAAAAGITGVAAATEIVVTRNNNVIAELDNIEEISINGGGVSVPGNDPAGGTATTTAGSDNVEIIGDFTATSLDFNTITIEGTEGDDTVDITGLQSAHRIVFRSNGGHDTIIGELRPQDVIELAPGSTLADYTASEADGMTTMSNGSHSFSFPTSGQPQFGESVMEEEEVENETDGGASTAAGLTLLGTDLDDVMVGGAGEDVLGGGGGGDLILGNGADDTLTGGTGDDLVKSGDGDDLVFGGEGDDDLFGGSGRDMIFGDEGDDRIFADAGDDFIEGGDGNDTVYGGSGDDWIIANFGDGDDVYWGEDGNDTLDYAAIMSNLVVDLGNGYMQHGTVSSADSGQDTIFGFENVIGGSGADTIIANALQNVLDGGGSSDTFVFRSATDADGDVIKGHQPGDVIDLSAIDADTGVAGKSAFVLASGPGFTAVGQVTVTHVSDANGDHTLVQGDSDGDAVADFTIDVEGRHNLTATDFNFG